MEQEKKQTLGILFLTIPRKRNKLGTQFRGTKKEANSRNPVPKHVSDKNTLPILIPGAGFFVKLIFFMSFRSVPSFEIDSSVNLGMPQNDHFLTRNKGNHSESIPRNFFATKFRCLPYSHVQGGWKRDTVYTQKNFRNACYQVGFCTGFISTGVIQIL
jgi:hypothetical protein